MGNLSSFYCLKKKKNNKADGNTSKELFQSLSDAALENIEDEIKVLLVSVSGLYPTKHSLP